MVVEGDLGCLGGVQDEVPDDPVAALTRRRILEHVRATLDLGVSR